MQVVKTGQIVTYTEYLMQPPKAVGKRGNMVGKPRLVREYPSGKKKWACDYRIPKVPIYDDETVLEFVRPRLSELAGAFSEGAMPWIADEDTRKWKCGGYCSVRAECEAWERAQGRELQIPE